MSEWSGIATSAALDQSNNANNTTASISARSRHPECQRRAHHLRCLSAAWEHHSTDPDQRIHPAYTAPRTVPTTGATRRIWSMDLLRAFRPRGQNPEARGRGRQLSRPLSRDEGENGQARHYETDPGGDAEAERHAESGWWSQDQRSPVADVTRRVRRRPHPGPHLPVGDRPDRGWSGVVDLEQSEELRELPAGSQRSVRPFQRHAGGHIEHPLHAASELQPDAECQSTLVLLGHVCSVRVDHPERSERSGRSEQSGGTSGAARHGTRPALRPVS